MKCVFVTDLTGKYNPKRKWWNMTIAILMIIIFALAASIISIIWTHMKDRLELEQQRYIDENIANVF